MCCLAQHLRHLNERQVALTLLPRLMLASVKAAFAPVQTHPSATKADTDVRSNTLA